MKMIKNFDFKKGLPQEFEIIELATLYQSSKSILSETHRANFYHIIWFQRGTSSHLIDFQSVEIEENTILFLNKQNVIQFDFNSNIKGKIIIFTDSFYCNSQSDTLFLKNSILFNDWLDITKIKNPSEELLTLFSMMESELSTPKDQLQANLLKNYLSNFLLLAERAKRVEGFTEKKKRADYDYFLLFRDLLEVNFSNHKKVNFYASAICSTEKRLNQAMNKIVGKTAKDLINDRILLEAKRLLVHTSLSIKEIGFELGFDEPTNFIKYYKKHTQTTPVEFRAKNKA